MGLSSRLLRLPRPKTFLYLMSLRTGTELITLSIAVNKLSGLYGMLALVTGVHLSPLQLSMYIYSLLALVLTAFLAPHIRKQSPLQCLALAWFYILDSIVNAAYTVAFSVTWFLVISQHHSDAQGHTAPGGGGKMMDDTAGFTNPKYNVSQVDIVATPAPGLADGQDAVAVGKPGSPGTTASSPSLGHGVLQPESVPSIVVISALWAVRVYFILVVMAYARSVLRQHLYTSSRTKFYASTDDVAENPFAEGASEGEGWKGKLGRIMVSVGRGYWLGSSQDDGWTRGMGGKFRRSTDVVGPVERERRRRSGTGPPPPPQPLRVQELQEVR